MNKKLLTFDDLYSFYSQKKKSMTFDCEKSGYNIAVQTKATFEVDESLSEGLLYGHVRAFHDLTNRNKSHIETDVLEEKMMSIKDRPVMADIVETDEKDENDNPIKDFSGHTMYYDEKLKKMVYKELPVGHFVNPESIRLEYDEELERNFVCSDAVIYEEYTDTCDILRRRQTVDCSVELCIRAMSWDNTDHTLHLDDFYVQGVTLLGKGVLPGMKGSKLTLKDFSEENNSLFSSISEDTHTKLIETLDNLNKTLSSLNINSKNDTKVFEKGGSAENMTKFEELLEKYGKTADDITFEYADMTDEELEAKFAELFDEGEDEPEIEEPEKDDNDDADEPEVKETESQDDDTADVDDTVEGRSEGETDNASDEDTDDEEKENFTKTFELSHEDVRSSLYALLAPLEETLNEWYWIANVYDTYFIYQSCCGNYYKQKYVTENDSVAFDGERQEVFAEFVTDEERKELEAMRSNYSSVVERLSKYEEAEELADKMTVFEDDAYKNYLETDEFKTLMSVENVKKFTKEELTEKADAALGKVVKTTKTFAMSADEPNGKKPSFLAFSRVESNTSFLDGLLKK